MIIKWRERETMKGQRELQRFKNAPPPREKKRKISKQTKCGRQTKGQTAGRASKDVEVDRQTDRLLEESPKMSR